MEKRAVLAIALSFVILVAWSYLFPPPEQPESAPMQTVEQGQQPPVEQASTGFELPPVAQPDEVAIDSEPVEAAAEQTLTVDNGRFEVVLTNRGGRAVSWRLFDHTTAAGQPLELLPQFESSAERTLSIELDDPSLTSLLSEALFAVERTRLEGSGEGGPGERIDFTWADGRGLTARKTLTFRDREWLVGVELDVVDRGRRLPARIAVGPGFGAQENSSARSTYHYAGQGIWRSGGQVTRIKPKKLVEAGGRVEGQIGWAGLEDQYFAALLIPQTRETLVSWRSVERMPLPAAEGDEAPDQTEPIAEPVLSVSVPNEGALLFVGPKDYRLLHRLGHGLEDAVWFATNGFLAAITKFIFLGLVWIHDHVAGNYGLAIIIATFILRTLLFPVNQFSMVSMKKAQLQMQRLQPKIKAIRNKYKKSKDAQARAKMNQETMELYRKEGVNPAGGLTGCLPLLAQFPILIGFYNMLTVAVELRGAPFFGWIADLSQKDPYYVTPLLMAVTMFVQQKMAMNKVTDPVQQQQQKMMLIMPVVFGWICIQMPAGMVLYWFINNVLGIGQQWLVNRHTGRLEAAAAQKA